MRISDIIFYVQCYWQAFGLGMITVLGVQHWLRKRNEGVSSRC